MCALMAFAVVAVAAVATATLLVPSGAAAGMPGPLSGKFKPCCSAGRASQFNAACTTLKPADCKQFWNSVKGKCAEFVPASKPVQAKCKAICGKMKTGMCLAPTKAPTAVVG